VLVPYREFERHHEHEYTFLDTNIPLTIDAFELRHVAQIDAASEPASMWNGQQILLVYTSREFAEEFCLCLGDIRVDEDWTSKELERLRTEVTSWRSRSEMAQTRWTQLEALTQGAGPGVEQRECQLADLQKANRERQAAGLGRELDKALTREREARHLLEDRERQIADLQKTNEERELQATALAQERDKALSREREARLTIAKREAQIAAELEHLRSEAADRNYWEFRARALEKSTSWRMTSGGRAVKTAGVFALQPGQIGKRVKHLHELARTRGLATAGAWLWHRLSEGQRTPASGVRSTSTGERSNPGQFGQLVGFLKGHPIAVVPCAFEFDALTNQRPINLCKHLSTEGYRVVYVAWQWRETDTLKGPNGEVYPGVFQVALYDYLALRAVLPTSEGRNGIFFITFPAQALLDAARSARSKGYVVVYDIMDDWAEFKKVGQAPWYSGILEAQAVLESDVVAVVSQPLKEKFDTLRTDIEVIGNGFSTSVIGESARNIGGHAPDPDYKIVAGYFGHLTDAWFDWQALLELAANRPDIFLELIGYGAPQSCLEAARALKNVSVVPPIHPSELKKYTARWNVGLIPFKPGPLARAVDPIKIYEYLYMGLPVVVTGISHVAQYPGTSLVEASADLEGTIVRQAASQELLRSDPAVGEFLAQATWTARFKRLTSLAQDEARIGSLYD
jgi:hypothetical protein